MTFLCLLKLVDLRTVWIYRTSIDSTESFHIPCTKSSLLLTSYNMMAHLSGTLFYLVSFTQYYTKEIYSQCRM